MLRLFTRLTALILVTLVGTTLGISVTTWTNFLQNSSPLKLSANSSTTSSAVQNVASPERFTTPLTNSRFLQVHFIDVGQGDSIFIQTPEGVTALIDGGPGNGTALRFLQAKGIDRIDVMIASHPHADHIGGLIEILHTMPVGVVWTSGAVHNTGTFERFLDAIIEAKVPYQEAQTGDIIPFGQLHFLVLHSNLKATNLNDSSLVVRLSYQAVSFLFTGDSEKSGEEQMLRQFSDQLTSTVLKVGHHGSASSSSSEFLAAVAPQVAVYSAGIDNQYGHPHPITLSRLQAMNIQIFGTSVDGTVVISTDGVKYQITTMEGTFSPSLITLHDPPLESAKATPSKLLDFVDDSTESDRDCRDFKTHAEAQTFFVAAGGPATDPHRLDGDRDGIACERLP